MDQVKLVLKYVKQYHFWLLVLVVFIAGLMGWSMGSKALSAGYSEKKSKILSKFKALEDIRKVDPHPNSLWKDGTTKLADEQRKNMRRAWDTVYNEQKALLKWPEELGKKFIDWVESHPADAEIPLSPYRAQFLEFTSSKALPKMLAIIDAMPADAPKQTAPGVPGPPAPDRVEWDIASQNILNAKLVREVVPDSGEVRRTQEDLWMYEVLLNIVKNINEGQIVPRIKKIEKLEVGRPAADAFEAGMEPGKIYKPRVEASGDGAGEAQQQPATATIDPDAKKEPDDGRYLDAEGKKLPTASDEQFKRMPVHMTLVMDQRQITNLLIECANSPLPVEVRQLRVNPGKALDASTPPSNQAGPAKQGQEGESYDVPVDLIGIIYIFNKPDVSKLGGEQPPAAPEGGATAAAGQ